MLVMARDTELLEEEKRWAPIDGRCWRTVVALRLYHASIREHVRAIIETAVAAGAKAPMAGDAIINQEDLLGMLLGFSIGTLDVLERFGIRLSDDEKEAYLVAWNHIGSLLGIGSVTVTSSLKGKAKPTKPTKPPTPLVPANCPDARRLSAQIRTRVWPDISALTLEQQLDSTDDGRQLIVAMLEDLRRSMPKFGKKLPQLVMRQLVDPRVRDRLALGEGGLLELGYGQFLELIKASPIGRTFDPGTLSGPALRSAANLVTRNSVISFLGEGKPPFVIPGLEEWIDAVGSSRRP